MAIILVLIVLLLASAPLAAVAGRWPHRSRWLYASSAAFCLALLLVASARLLAGAPAVTLTLPLGLPWVGAHFRLDPLAEFFLLVINLGGLGASVYGIGYGEHESAPGRVLPFYPAFLAALNLVLLAADAFTFLVAWEFMSLTSWALVMAHHREPGNARAGYVYLLMAGAGALLLVLAFGLLAGASGGYSFAAMRAARLTPAMTALVMLLALLGAGSKAGLVPLHVWLPLAHPAAPSHGSALMSGVMTKVAIYAFIRIVFDLLGPPAWWWGALVLIVGGISAALGLLYALLQNDLKRLLAYSTVENIGIVFVALGLALAFQANGFSLGAALALTAALFHVLNHSLFKSLLFLGAGAVHSATGERDMDRLGGLIQRLPVTAFTFLIGAAAIAALPPLNGFVSEWLTFQAILLSPALPQWALKLAVPAVGALLALSAALAATCFVKGFGLTFLSRPRTPAASTATEVNRWMLAPMLGLVVLCVLAGILPGPVVDALGPVVRLLNHGTGLPLQTGQHWLSLIPIGSARSSYNGLLVLLFMLSAGGLSAWAIHRWASRRVRRSPAWDCGYPEPSPLTQYSAASFAQPLRRVFGQVVFRARETVTMPAPGEPGPARFELRLVDPVWDTLFTPVSGILERVTRRLNQLQFLTIRQYLTLVFCTLIILLTVLAVWQ